jgi:hypothetical protein
MERAKNGINTETEDSLLGSLGAGTKKAKITNAPHMSKYNNTHIENIAMPCPMCIVAKNRIETFNVYEIRSFGHHLSSSHGMER